MPKDKTTISIILPVYNENKLLGPSVNTIHSFMSQHFETFEIVIVESGSTDGTGAVCDALAAEHPNVRVVHEGARNGFGAALKLGYRNARYDYCWLVTADLPFPLESILQAVPLLKEVDFVISYRSEDNRAITRRIQSFGYNTLVKMCYGLRMRCINSAFKLLPTKVMAAMPIESHFWFVDAEILYRLTRAGYRYKEIPVPLIDRTEGASSVASNAFVKMLEEMRAFSRIRHTIPDLRKKSKGREDK